MSAEIKTTVKKTGRSLGDIILLLVKIFAYFIIGCVSFGLVVALFFLAIGAIGVFPLKDYLLDDGWQNVYAWGTLLFFIAVPVVGVITWIIRRLAKMRSNGKVLRFSFISLWILGWFCVVFLVASISQDFRRSSNINEQEIALANPTVNKLELTTNSPAVKYYRNNWFRLEPFELLEDDTAFVRNYEVKIFKSTSDSFKVTIIKMANSEDRKAADALASKINFNMVQNDSLIVLDKGIAITKQNKFRNQHVIISVYVPVGKKIKIDKSVGWGSNVRFGGPWDDNTSFDVQDEERGWDIDEEYIMKADGLYNLSGTPADEDESRHPGWKKIKVDENGVKIDTEDGSVDIDENGVSIKKKKDTYRYDTIKAVQAVDTTNVKEEKKRIKDSLQNEKSKIDKQLNKIETSSLEPGGLTQLKSYSLLVNVN